MSPSAGEEPHDPSGLPVLFRTALDTVALGYKRRQLIRQLITDAAANAIPAPAATPVIEWGQRPVQGASQGSADGLAQETPNDLIREPADSLAPPIDGPVPPLDGPVPPLPAMAPTTTITGSVYDTMDESDLADNSVSYSTQASGVEPEPAFDTERQGHQRSMSPQRTTARMVHAGGLSEHDLARTRESRQHSGHRSKRVRHQDIQRQRLATETVRNGLWPYTQTGGQRVKRHPKIHGGMGPGRLPSSPPRSSFSEPGKAVEDIRRYRESPVPGPARSPPPPPCQGQTTSSFCNRLRTKSTFLRRPWRPRPG